MTQTLEPPPRQTPGRGVLGTGTAPAPRSPRTSYGRRRDRRRLRYAFPAVAFLVLFFVYPVVLLVRMSFQEVSLGTVARGPNPFVGLANYREVLPSADFLEAVPRTIFFVVTTVVVQLVLGLALALILNSRMRGVRVGRSLVFFIWLLPPAVSGAIWKFLLTGTDQGALNSLLMAVGLVDRPIVFLTQPNVAMVIITLINSWAYLPFVAIVLMAALQNLPEDVFEAAKVDGAGPTRRFTAITLPFLLPTLVIVALLQTIYSFKQFDFIFVLTQGGPGTATSTVPYLAYLRSFIRFDFGQGAVIGVVGVAAAALLAAPYVLRARREEAVL